jgi:adenylate cyclase
MTDKVKRRLTTVLCADVHGYSRLMEADEAGTLAELQRHRTAMARLVERHDGRIVNTWGDAVIAEFASVVEAVQCAIETQQEIAGEASDPAPARRMRFRNGINLGDVMVDGADIYGDGVNIAARLQELAEPGGIVISSTVYDQVRNKLSVGFDCLGQQPMKNVAPVTSYRVAMADGDSVHDSALAGENPPRRGTASSAGPAAPPIEHAALRGEHRLPEWMHFLGERLANLPRPIAAALTVAGFLILINLFTNPHRIWFHWPVAGLLFFAIMRTVRRRGRGPDRKEDR